MKVMEVEGVKVVMEAEVNAAEEVVGEMEVVSLEESTADWVAD